MTTSRATKLVNPIDQRGHLVTRAMGLPIKQDSFYLGSATEFAIVYDLSLAKHISRVFTGISVRNPSPASSVILAAISDIGDTPYEFLKVGTQQYWTLDNLMYGPGITDESEARNTNYILGRLDVAQGTQATGILTYTGQPADQEFITLMGADYEFSSDSSKQSGSEYIVAIGATANVTYTNLVTAINLSQRHVKASINTGTGEVTLTANPGGTSGNTITFSESASNVTASGAVLSGGAGGVLPDIHIW